MFDVAEDQGIRDVWCWALSWFRRPSPVPARRAKQTVLIGAYVEGLRHLHTVADLHASYAADGRWRLTLAKELYPRDWTALGVHACTAAAYGLRYVELVTGRYLIARDLPRWVSEWAVW